MRISGLEYIIEYVDPSELGGSIATADFDNQRIKISFDATAQTQCIAKLHETIHILDKVYGIELEERQVVLLAHALIALKADNPHADII